MMEPLLNKYHIHWVLLVPVKGKTTKRDIQSLNSKVQWGYGAIGAGAQVIGRHFVDKKSAESDVKKIKGVLAKEYKAYIITDAQFGMIKIDFVKGENEMYITQKQIKASKIVK